MQESKPLKVTSVRKTVRKALLPISRINQLKELASTPYLRMRIRELGWDLTIPQEPESEEMILRQLITLSVIRLEEIHGEAGSKDTGSNNQVPA